MPNQNLTNDSSQGPNTSIQNAENVPFFIPDNPFPNQPNIPMNLVESFEQNMNNHNEQSQDQIQIPNLYASFEHVIGNNNQNAGQHQNNVNQDDIQSIDSYRDESYRDEEQEPFNVDASEILSDDENKTLRSNATDQPYHDTSMVNVRPRSQSCS